jgi:hypothetical protein
MAVSRNLLLQLRHAGAKRDLSHSRVLPVK